MREQAEADQVQQRTVERVQQESRRRHHAVRLPEPPEPLGVVGVPQRVMVHDHPAAGAIDDAQQMLHPLLDQHPPHARLEVRRRPCQVQQTRPLADQVRRGHRGQRPLHVRGVHEPEPLPAIRDGQRHHVAEPPPFHPVGERR